MKRYEISVIINKVGIYGYSIPMELLILIYRYCLSDITLFSFDRFQLATLINRAYNCI